MKKKALLIIDVQKGMFQADEPVCNGNGLLLVLKNLIEKAHAADVPIFYIQHNASNGLVPGTECWEIHNEIFPQEYDYIIQKHYPDSFLKTTLHAKLQELGIEHLFLTGIQTEVCVDTTSRSAFSLGYDVTLVSDAHSTWNSGNLSAQQIISHHNSVLRWFCDIKPSEEISFKWMKLL
ncbi:cysteine hydrolase family protein [Peribacillus kribbensis]|uniref:cysteine hydrolase family protein n=1 Tax=Peribacillus kribbensis TaxID=356658 RepID=UPI0003F72CF0|nr:cysteine hydrolase family protein [Peribacillus kribbensis]